MEYVGDDQISEGINTVKIIVGKEIIDNDTLKWNEEDYGSFGERHITLREIFEQLSKRGIEGVISVWEETPLKGSIYQCSNCEVGQWVIHGTTKGYA